MDNKGIWDLEEAKQSHCYCVNLAEWVKNRFNPSLPVYDIGCGLGLYCNHLKDKFFINGYEGTANIETISAFHPIHCVDLTKPLLLPPAQVLCIEVGEHIPAEYQFVILNTISNCTKTKCVLSWAIEGNAGYGHVNCRNNDWVIEQMNQRGLKLNTEQTESVRSIDFEMCHWFKGTTMVFDRIKPLSSTVDICETTDATHSTQG